MDAGSVMKCSRERLLVVRLLSLSVTCFPPSTLSTTLETPSFQPLPSFQEHTCVYTFGNARYRSILSEDVYSDVVSNELIPL